MVRRQRADNDAFFEARVAALHAGLTLNPDQDKLWPALETAIRDLNVLNRGSRGPEVGSESSPMGAPQADAQPFDALKRTAEDFETRGRILASLADAGAPLYATLSTEQKGRLPILMRDLTPQRGPFHRLVAALADHDDRDGATDRDPKRGQGMKDERRADRESWDDGNDRRDRWSDRERLDPRGRRHAHRDRYNDDRDD